MAAFKVDATRTRELIARIDADRARFVRETTGSEITATSQHLCIDTCAIPLDVAEDMVVRVVEDRKKTLA